MPTRFLVGTGKIFGIRLLILLFLCYNYLRKGFGFTMKKLFKYSLIIVLMCFLVLPVQAKEKDLVRMKGIINHDFKEKPYIVDSVSNDTLFMLPLRETMETLGYNVTWYRDGRITVKKGLIRASLIVNKDEYRDRYDELKKIYTTPVYNDGVCYVPNTFFTQVLEYDTFIIGDTVYLRKKIDGIISRSSESIIKYENSGTSDVTIAYPAFTSKKYEFVNREIEKYIERIKEEYRFDQVNLLYDIAISNSKVVSVIFKGDLISGEDSKYFFDSLNFDIKNQKKIDFKDIIVDTNSSNKFLKEKMNLDDDYDFRIEDFKMYIVKDALVIYKNSEQNKTINKYFKLYELEHLSSKYGEFLFER